MKCGKPIANAPAKTLCSQCNADCGKATSEQSRLLKTRRFGDRVAMALVCWETGDRLVRETCRQYIILRATILFSFPVLTCLGIKETTDSFIGRDGVWGRKYYLTLTSWYSFTPPQLVNVQARSKPATAPIRNRTVAEHRNSNYGCFGFVDFITRSLSGCPFDYCNADRVFYLVPDTRPKDLYRLAETSPYCYRCISRLETAVQHGSQRLRVKLSPAQYQMRLGRWLCMSLGSMLHES